MNPSDDPTPEPGDDPVAALFHVSGSRVDPSQDVLAELRASARSSWEEMLDRRRVRRRRILALAAGLVGAVVGGLLFLRPLLAAPVATVVARTGEGANGGEGWIGRDLRPGQAVRTTEGVRLALELAGGGTLRVDGSSDVEVLGEGRFALREGALYLDSEGRPESNLVVEVDGATITDIGTRFEVRAASDGLAVRVRDGRVAVRDADEIVTVEAESELVRRAGRPDVRRGLAPWADEWTWVVAAAPPIPVVGRTVAEVLEQVAREGGRTLEIADPALAERLRETRVGGRLPAMEPEIALQTVLATAALRGRSDGGRLVVESGDSG